MPTPGHEWRVDGASRGNPGPSGIGVAVFREGSEEPVRTVSQFIGAATNNEAEYTALIYALQDALVHGERSVRIRSDSELLVQQVSGVYRVREPRLRALHAQVSHLRTGLERFELRRIPREQNTHADRLAGQAITSALGARLF